MPNIKVPRLSRFLFLNFTKNSVKLLKPFYASNQTQFTMPSSPEKKRKRDSHLPEITGPVEIKLKAAENTSFIPIVGSSLRLNIGDFLGN